MTPADSGPASRLRRLGQIVSRTWYGTFRDDVAFYSAAIAFNSLFSIFALLFLLSLLLSLFGASPSNLEILNNFATGLVPEKAQEFVTQAIELTSRPVPKQLIPLAIVAMLWTASNVVQALIHALNRIYDLEESRAFWRTRLMALTVVGVSSLFLVLAFLLLVFGGELSQGMEEVRRLRGNIARIVLEAKQIVSVLAVFLGSSLIYWLAPSFKHEHRVSWPGAVMFTGTWILATIGFNLYLRHVAVYDKVYGSMATVVVLLTWVYLSAYLALVGGELNAAVHRQRLEEAVGASSDRTP